MAPSAFFNRDISWLSFNERVLAEAAKTSVPLMDRVRFLSIYSSNLDEFYRVRIPVILALHKLSDDYISESTPGEAHIYEQTNAVIQQQLDAFGKILTQSILPALKQHGIYMVYNEPIPVAIRDTIAACFFNQLAAFIEIIFIKKQPGFFPENNSSYIAVLLKNEKGEEDIAFVNIPSGNVSRFYNVVQDGTHYIVFIDDIIKAKLSFIFPGYSISGAYSIKITRDAELNINDEFEGDIAEKIERQLTKRDFGLATRILYQPGIPVRMLQFISGAFSLSGASFMEGGAYHNLKDLADIPVNDPALSFPKLAVLDHRFEKKNETLFEQILQKDVLVHTPYESYNSILRFFNEAAISEDVTEIYVTLYRVANDSKIVHALISAAKNGKKVTVFVELKARFDEANNIRWAKSMKAAGVRILYSIPGLKVHAKVALVKKKKGDREIYFALLATGNLNENTARFYTDHILLTANRQLVQELELLFLFLTGSKKPKTKNEINFQHLLVAQFNLQQAFLTLIDNEIANVRKGLPAGIFIKLNNLEEETMINKLYEASNAGVKINLVVRSICRLIPGVPNQSENITVKRIIDRFLEHGRVFIFTNNNEERIFLGSADWMNRNIHHRIEVCFPVYDERLKKEIKQISLLQQEDTVAAVSIDNGLNNIPAPAGEKQVRSQEAIYTYLQNRPLHD